MSEKLRGILFLTHTVHILLGAIGLVVDNLTCNFTLQFKSQRVFFASNLGEVSNLLHAQVHSASYPQRDGKWVVAHGLLGEWPVCLTGVVVCLRAALLQIQLFVCCAIISSCQSAATSHIVKAIHVFDSCKQLCVSYWTFTFILYCTIYLPRVAK